MMSKNRMLFLLASLLLVCLVGGISVAPAVAADRPNILLIVADDLGWKDVGYHGSHCLTPHLDQLAADGIELDQHYVQPVCTPTRAALMTGRYPSRFGPHATVPSNLRALPPGTVTLPAILQSVGYETYLAGKWHLGSRVEWGPLHYGFQHAYGSLAGAADPWTHQYRKGDYAATWHRDHKFLQEEGNVTELLAKQTSAWIHERKSPWFVYVPFTAVHIPIDTPEKYKQLYADKTFYDDPVKDASFKRFAAFVSQLDAKVGELLAAVKESGQQDNTLVLFFSDNGGLAKGGNAYISDVPATPVLSDNSPLRGFKATLYEGGIRVPALISWPGKLTHQKFDQPMHVVDWMPTLCALTGAKPKQDLHWDGTDVWPQLTGNSTAEDRIFYWKHTTGQALRDGDWKLIVAKDGRKELFNLAEDPSEKHNLAEKQPERVASLLNKLTTLSTADELELPADLHGLQK